MIGRPTAGPPPQPADATGSIHAGREHRPGFRDAGLWAQSSPRRCGLSIGMVRKVMANCSANKR